jgi:hypothetical protein
VSFSAPHVEGRISLSWAGGSEMVIRTALEQAESDRDARRAAGIMIYALLVAIIAVVAVGIAALA